MPDNKPRLLIADQSLSGFEGHHLDYGRSLIAAAKRGGMVPLLACHTNFPDSELDGAPVVGRFKTSWEGARRSWINDWGRKILFHLPEHLRYALLDRLSARLTIPAEAETKPDPKFADELQRISVEAGLVDNDHIFAHTLGEAEFLGLAMVLNNKKPSNSPWLHLMLRYDGTASYREAFARLAQTDAKIRYWTDTQFLADHYLSLGCPSIGVLPIPHGLEKVPERIRPSDAPLTLAYLGGARADKGFHLLPDLVASLADPYLANGQVRFVIQTTFGLSREAPLMAKTLRALRRFPKSWIEFIEKPPNSHEFSAALHATNLLLLPYDRQTYAYRSSGLMIQAMAAGIPTVVPTGTWLAEEAPEGAHLAYSDDLEDTVRQALANHTELLVNARKEMKAAHARHNADRLIELLLGSVQGS